MNLDFRNISRASLLYQLIMNGIAIGNIDTTAFDPNEIELELLFNGEEIDVELVMASLNVHTERSEQESFGEGFVAGLAAAQKQIENLQV